MRAVGGPSGSVVGGQEDGSDGTYKGQVIKV